MTALSVCPSVSAQVAHKRVHIDVSKTCGCNYATTSSHTAVPRHDLRPPHMVVLHQDDDLRRQCWAGYSVTCSVVGIATFVIDCMYTASRFITPAASGYGDSRLVKVVFPAVLARCRWFSGTRSDVFITFGKNSAVAQMAAQCCTSRIFAVKWGHPSLTHFFSVISENIATRHTLAKSVFFGLHF